MIYELKNKASTSEEGEAILGFQDTGSHTCYMIYGILKPKEKGRVIKPGEGHEEIVIALKGNLKVKGFYSGILNEGYAIHIKGNEECFFDNVDESETVYIIAGGHLERGHH